LTNLLRNRRAAGSSQWWPPHRGHTASAIPETCCHQYPVPASSRDQLPPPHVRIPRTKKGEEERETMIRHGALADIRSLDVTLPFRGRGGRGCLFCFYFYVWLASNGCKEVWHSKYHKTRLCALPR